MKLYRFSPIQSEEELRGAIEYMHFKSFEMCMNTFSKYLLVAGNIGIFCHYEDEYERLVEIRKELTEESDNWNQKYFKLHSPITIKAKDDVPEATYTYLYIRKPDPYRHHVGDIDFVLSEEDYTALKAKMESGYQLPDARLFPSPRLDMIELHHPDSDVLTYVSTHKMTDLVKDTKSES